MPGKLPRGGNLSSYLGKLVSLVFGAPASRWLEAWRSLRTKLVFIIAVLHTLLVLTSACFPQLFTQESPTECNIKYSLQGPSPEDDGVCRA